MNEYEDLKEQLLAKIASITKKSKFLTTEDVEFFRSDIGFAKDLDAVGAQVQECIKELVLIGIEDENVKVFDGPDVDRDFAAVVDILDDIYERADMLIESEKKPKITEAQGIPYADVSNDRKPIVGRSQLKFKDKIDNSNTPWVPIIKFKPNAIRPLSITVSEIMQTHLDSLQANTGHPYEYEIQNIIYPKEMFVSAEEILYQPMSETKLTWVDKIEELSKLCKLLENCEAFAVDLEHHDYRSFQGFTCLIQISTRDEDFIIDALSLRNDLHLLNNSFTNSNIIKVFHGADMDIQWLQRDFGVYVVNLFDTFHASHVLEMPKHSFAYLLENYCQIKADKKYQTADWRVRPLSQEMIHYARSDTHYLLYIYDMMRNALVEGGSHNLMMATLNRSAETALKKYQKNIYDAESGEGPGGWKNMLRKSPEALSNENLAVFRAVHAWRDHTARKEDESPLFVLPNHMVFKLARVMPVKASDVFSCCIPTPTLVREHAAEIAEVIRQSLESFHAQSPSSPVVVIDEKPISAPIHVHFNDEVKPIMPHVPKHNFEFKFLQSSSIYGKILSTSSAGSCIEKANQIRSSLFLDAPGFEEQECLSEQEIGTIKEMKNDTEIATSPTKRNVENVESESEEEIIATKRKKLQGFKPFDYTLAKNPVAETFQKPKPFKAGTAKKINSKSKGKGKRITY